MTLTQSRSEKYFLDFPALHSDQLRVYRGRSRRDLLRCGRRWGKSFYLEVRAARRAAAGQEVGWFTPTYKLLRPSYRRVAELLLPITTHSSKGEFYIQTVTGGGVEFWSMEDEDAGRSRGYDLVQVDEASLQSGLKDRWEQSIAPTLLDRRGDAVLAGTPKGIDDENYFYLASTDKSKGWKEFYAPSVGSPRLSPEDIDQFKRDFPPLVFQQEYLAEFIDWSGDAFFALPSLLENGEAVGFPKHCDAVFATIDTAVKSGREHDGTGVVYWALTLLPRPKMWILDWDYIQVEGAVLEVWLRQVFETAKQLATASGSRRGFIGTFIEDKASGSILIQQAKRRGWPAHEIDSALTAVGKDERAISVSGYVFRGQVRLTTQARNRMVNFKGDNSNHLEKQVIGYHVGQKDRPDDLLDCFCYGIAIGMGNAEGY